MIKNFSIEDLSLNNKSLGIYRLVFSRAKDYVHILFDNFSYSDIGVELYRVDNLIAIIPISKKDFDAQFKTKAPVVIDKDLLWCKEHGISIYEKIEPATVEEFTGCTGHSVQYTMELFKSVGVDLKKPISYALFNRLCISLGIRYREQHRKVVADFEIVKTFEAGHKLIKFQNRKFPVYCMNDKTFDGVRILEVVA